MKNIAVFTSTIAPDLALWLNKEAKKQKKTKRSILEAALNQYRRALRQKELADSFHRASLDPEIRAMSEEGLEDSINQLHFLDL